MQQSPDYLLAGVCVYRLLTSAREAEWRRARHFVIFWGICPHNLSPVQLDHEMRNALSKAIKFAMVQIEALAQGTATRISKHESINCYLLFYYILQL